MKKLLFLISLSSLFMTACQKTVDQPVAENIILEQQEAPRCGMEEAMANMSAEMKQAMLNNTLKTDAQAAELLIFLDFDGATIRPGFGNAQGGFVTSPLVSGTRTCSPPNLTTEQKNTIIELVEDDFSPFNIQFTTDQSVYDAYPVANKQVCIVTTFPSVLGQPNFVAGVSPFAGLTFRLSNNPCFVFASVYGNLLSEIAFTISHEVGHTMGLGHQSRYDQNCNFSNEYHSGFGTGLLSFVPIMGNSFGKRIINWFAQPCLVPGYGIPQNDFVFLNDQVNLKEDDFPNESTGGSIVLGNEITGVLEQAGDVDFIRINFRNPGPVTITSENIDIKASLFLPNGQLIAEYENPDDTHVTIPSANGLKYLKIEAVSNVNMSSQFMTGQYKITH
jgi:hypothetical protein